MTLARGKDVVRDVVRDAARDVVMVRGASLVLLL